MNTKELTAILSNNPCTGKFFRGVVACDELPGNKLRDFPASYVVNTHPRNKPGEHWLALYVDDDKTGEFFDSYGNPPDYIYFPDSINIFLQKNCDRIVFNAVQVQDPLSAMCGQHCFFYLHHRSKGIPFSRIIALYSDNLKMNDFMVAKYAHKIRLDKCEKNMLSCVQTANSFITFKSCHACK